MHIRVCRSVDRQKQARGVRPNLRFAIALPTDLLTIYRLQNTSRAASFSRYSDTIRTLQDVSVGGQEFGKAEVDCCFHGSDSKWGTIESDNVGIIYFELTLSQDSKYSLDWVTVRMCFQAHGDTTGTLPTVTRYLAPQLLWGPERQEQVSDNVVLRGKVDIAGIAGIDIGEVGRKVDYQRPKRWSFRGERRRIDASGNQYQIVQWKWVSDPNDKEGELKRLHLGVTIQHASKPFFIEVGVEGKLKGHKLRTMRSKFKTKENKRMATITPQVLQKRDLLDEALNLEREIRKRNIVSLPRKYFVQRAWIITLRVVYKSPLANYNK